MSKTLLYASKSVYSFLKASQSVLSPRLRREAQKSASAPGRTASRGVTLGSRGAPREELEKEWTVYTPTRCEVSVVWPHRSCA